MRYLIVRPFFILALVTLGVSGCVQAPRFAVGPELNEIESKALCISANSANKGRRLDSFRALLEAQVAEGESDEAASFRYAVVAQGSHKLRVDVLPLEGAFTLALLTIRGDQALLIDTQERTALEGCTVPQLLERLFGLQSLTPEEVRAIILGRLPELDCSRVAAHSVDAESVTFTDKKEQIAWEINRDSLELERVYFLDSSGARVSALASRENSGQGGAIRVTIYKPARAKASLHLVKLAHNPEISETTFVVAVPDGYARRGC